MFFRPENWVAIAIVVISGFVVPGATVGLQVGTFPARAHIHTSNMERCLVFGQDHATTNGIARRTLQNCRIGRCGYYGNDLRTKRRKRPRGSNLSKDYCTAMVIRMVTALVFVSMAVDLYHRPRPIPRAILPQAVSSFAFSFLAPTFIIDCDRHRSETSLPKSSSTSNCCRQQKPSQLRINRHGQTRTIVQSSATSSTPPFTSDSNNDINNTSSVSSMRNDAAESEYRIKSIHNSSVIIFENENNDCRETTTLTVPSQKNGANTMNRSTSDNATKNQHPRPRRVIPPTEIELQQLKQMRQEAYEKVCGPSSPITYDDDENTVLIDTGATYNATKELIFDTTSTLSSTFSLPTPNTTSVIIPTSVANTTALENVYVQLNTTTTTTNTTFTINNISNEIILQQGLLTPLKKKKQKPASIWSFESLFPEPVLDTESIEKDLYRNINRTTTTSSNNSNTVTPSLSLSDVPPSQLPFPDVGNILQNSILASVSIVPTTEKSSQKDTFLYGGSGVVRKEKKPSPQQSLLNQEQSNTAMAMTNRSAYSNSSSSGKVDPLLTRMVEDRVYGYRRLPTGVLQYETSMMGPDNAIQFRNGVRLGNPLPINADVLSYLAKKELQKGRIEEACELYEKAVSIDPADGRAYLGLSKCAERRRDFTLARKWLVQGINRSVSVQQLQSPAQKERKNTSSSSNKNNRNNGNELEQSYTETTTLIPDRGANPYLLQALGCLEEKLGRLTQAERLYAEAVKSRPYHTAAWVSLAVLRTRKLGYPVRAGRECFQCAERELQIAHQPPSSYIYTSWANLEYHKANDKNRARELFQKAIQIDPKCSAAWLQLGVLEAACENWDAAELCFDTVLKFDQRNTRVLQAYAIMETKRPSGDSRKAIGLFERAVQTNPRDAGVYQPYALYVAELGDMNMARSLLQKGTQVNKRHAAVWQAWGVLETRYGDADTARKIFQEGIWACGQLSGSQSGGYHCDRLWQAWGVLEANEKEYAAARRCFSRALDANNRNVPAFTAWALMEEQLGNVKDARIIFERGLHKFSTGSEEKKALYRSYELMEQRLGDTTAAQNIYQRSVRESFNEKDEIDILKTSVMVNTRPTNEMDDVTVAQQQATVTKKTKEFEVVRWENTGGEVWLNDRAIEAKVSITNKKMMSSRDGNNKDTKSNNTN